MPYEQPLADLNTEPTCTTKRRYFIGKFFNEYKFSINISIALISILVVLLNYFKYGNLPYLFLILLLTFLKSTDIFINYYLHCINLHNKSKYEHLQKKNLQYLSNLVNVYDSTTTEVSFSYINNISNLNHHFIKNYDNYILRFTKSDIDISNFVKSNISQILNNIVDIFVYYFSLKNINIDIRSVNLAVFSTFKPYDKNFEGHKDGIPALEVIGYSKIGADGFKKEILLLSDYRKLKEHNPKYMLGDFYVIDNLSWNYIPDVDNIKEYINLLIHDNNTNKSSKHVLDKLLKRLRNTKYNSILSIPIYLPHTSYLLGILHIDSPHKDFLNVTKHTSIKNNICYQINEDCLIDSINKNNILHIQKSISLLVVLIGLKLIEYKMSKDATLE